MTMYDIEKIITKHLKDRFIEKDNKDFYFKSNNLPLPFDNRVIGRVLKYNIATKGLVELWSTNRANRVSVWKTCFNGGT